MAYLYSARRRQLGRQELVSTLQRSRNEAEGAKNMWMERYRRRDVRMVHEMRARELDGNARPADGMQTFRDFIAGIDLINEHSYAMSPEQSEILLMCLQAILQQIFTQSELMQHLTFLLDYFGMDELFEDVIIQMRRRGGKTIVISCFIALFIVCMPKGNTNVFSSGSRVSKAMKDVVRGVVKKLVAHGERFRGCRVVTDNKETLQVTTVHGTLNTVNFFPSNEKIGANVSDGKWKSLKIRPTEAAKDDTLNTRIMAIALNLLRDWTRARDQEDQEKPLPVWAQVISEWANFAGYEGKDTIPPTAIKKLKESAMGKIHKLLYRTFGAQAFFTEDYPVQARMTLTVDFENKEELKLLFAAFGTYRSPGTEDVPPNSEMLFFDEDNPLSNNDGPQPFSSWVAPGSDYKKTEIATISLKVEELEPSDTQITGEGYVPLGFAPGAYLHIQNGELKYLQYEREGEDETWKERPTPEIPQGALKTLRLAFDLMPWPEDTTPLSNLKDQKKQEPYNEVLYPLYASLRENKATLFENTGIGDPEVEPYERPEDAELSPSFSPPDDDTVDEGETGAEKTPPPSPRGKPLLTAVFKKYPFESELKTFYKTTKNAVLKEKKFSDEEERQAATKAVEYPGGKGGQSNVWLKNVKKRVKTPMEKDDWPGVQDSDEAKIALEALIQDVLEEIKPQVESWINDKIKTAISDVKERKRKESEAEKESEEQKEEEERKRTLKTLKRKIDDAFQNSRAQMKDYLEENANISELGVKREDAQKEISDALDPKVKEWEGVLERQLRNATSDERQRILNDLKLEDKIETWIKEAGDAYFEKLRKEKEHRELREKREQELEEKNKERRKDFNRARTQLNMDGLDRKKLAYQRLVEKIPSLRFENPASGKTTEVKLSAFYYNNDNNDMYVFSLHPNLATAFPIKVEGQPSASQRGIALHKTKYNVYLIANGLFYDMTAEEGRVELGDEEEVKLQVKGRNSKNLSVSFWISDVMSTNSQAVITHITVTIP